MEALNLLNLIRNNLDNNSEIELTSPTMYDPDKLENKVSFNIFERNDKGLYVKFHILIDDVTKK